jgi:hypothetical protein
MGWFVSSIVCFKSQSQPLKKNGGVHAEEGIWQLCVGCNQLGKSMGRFLIEKSTVAQLVKNFLEHFIEPESSLPCLQKPLS